MVETLHPLNESGFCSVWAADFAAHLDYLSGLGEQVWVAPVGTVAPRLLQWRRTDLRLAVPSAARMEVQLLGSGAGGDWRVVVRLDNPPEWSVVDGEGRPCPVEAGKEYLTFCWPADQSDAPVTLLSIPDRSLRRAAPTRYIMDSGSTFTVRAVASVAASLRMGGRACAANP